MSSQLRLAMRWLSALGCVSVLLIAWALSLPGEAAARPGSGQSFGGSSKSNDSGSTGSDARSNGGSSRSSGRSSNNSSSESRDSSWSKAPDFSAPWSTPAPAPKPTTKQTPGRNPHGGSYTPRIRPVRPSGNATEYFFWIVVGLFMMVGGLVVSSKYLINRGLANWVEDGRRPDEWESGLEAHVPGLAHVDGDPDDGELPAPREDPRYDDLRAALIGLRAKDPDFSFVVFEDFMYALYAELHTARGNQTLDVFEPYLGADAKRWLAERQVDGIEGIIVGAMRVESVRVDEGLRRVEADVVFTANYTASEGDVHRSFYVEEKWLVSRSADVLSRPPEKSRVIGCPNCGAALERAVAGKCKYCSEAVTNGELDWRVDNIEELAREERAPVLTGTTEEVGTNAPTLVAADANRALLELMRRGGFTWNEFSDRVRLVFAQFHGSWSSQDLRGVRPFLSDALFDVQRYWVETYKAEGLRNVTEEPTITTVELSRVLSDAHFDSITVRVAGFCKDYTLDAGENVVAGSKSEVRFYTEYWTLIRAARVRGAAKATAVCPSCGAPADQINMAGSCDACRVKITLGGFDWLLSRIEQDEVFRL